MSNHFSSVRENPCFRTLMWSWPSLGNWDLGLGLRPVSNFNYCYQNQNYSHEADEVPPRRLAAEGLFKASTDAGLVLTIAQHKPVLLAHLHRNEFYPESTA